MLDLTGLQPKSFYCTDNADDSFDQLREKSIGCFSSDQGFCSEPLVGGGDCSVFHSCQMRENSTHVRYGPSDMDTTIATDFDLICDDVYKVGKRHLIAQKTRLGWRKTSEK